jgi:hypothetical protein
MPLLPKKTEGLELLEQLFVLCWVEPQPSLGRREERLPVE